MYAIRIIIYIAALVASFFSFIYCETWITLLLFIAAILIPILSGLLGLLGARRISYHVSAPQSVICGDRLDIMVCDNGGSKTLNYSVTMTIDYGYGEIGEWRVELYDGSSAAHTLLTERCCAIRCSIKSAFAYDALGLFRLRLRPVNDAVICVLPQPQRPESLPGYSLAVHRAYMPKYGGGFAEVHDMRAYRPGDSMRDIHWKLSAKTDSLVVREPQRPVYSSVVITIDLEAPSQSLDGKLASLLWVSGWLLKNNVEHEVCWLDPADGQAQHFSVTSAAEHVPMVREMLVRRVTRPLPSIAEMPFAKVDWHYHIGGEVQQ